MKSFLIDLILVVLILIIATTFFSKDSLQEKNFNQAIDEFEVSIKNEEVVEAGYVSAVQDEENGIAKTSKYISETAVDGIKVVVNVFSELVDSIFK